MEITNLSPREQQALAMFNTEYRQNPHMDWTEGHAISEISGQLAIDESLAKDIFDSLLEHKFLKKVAPEVGYKTKYKEDKKYSLSIEARRFFDIETTTPLLKSNTNKPILNVKNGPGGQMVIIQGNQGPVHYGGYQNTYSPKQEELLSLIEELRQPLTQNIDQPTEQLFISLAQLEAIRSLAAIPTQLTENRIGIKSVLESAANFSQILQAINDPRVHEGVNKLVDFISNRL